MQTKWSYFQWRAEFIYSSEKETVWKRWLKYRLFVVGVGHLHQNCSYSATKLICMWKKLQKFAASSIFFKRKSNWLKTPIKSQHKQNMWGVRNSIYSHFHVSTWLNNTKQIPVWYFDMKLSSIVLWRKWGKSNAGNRLQGFHLNSYMKYE